jgi:hypothetical protein
MTDAIQRGLQADTLLANEFFREVLNKLDEEYHERWHQAKTVEAREDLHRYVTLIPKLIADIQSISNSGKLEQARQKELDGKRGILAWPMAR